MTEHMSRLGEFEQYLVEVQKEFIKEYSPQQQHFQIGDLAYVMDTRYSYYDPVLVEIIEISDFRKEPDDGGYIYYWYRHADIPKWELVLRELWWRIWEKLPWFIARRTRLIKDNGRFGPGHAVLAGANEDLFNDPKQCVLDHEICTALNCIDNLEYYIPDHNESTKG